MRCRCLIRLLLGSGISLLVHAQGLAQSPVQVMLQSALATSPMTEVAYLSFTDSVFDYGYAGPDSSGFRETVHPVGSIGKTLVAIGMWQQLQYDRPGLDAKVADLIPEIAIDNLWEAETPLTVRHLLQHTSGLDDLRYHEYFAGEGESPLLKQRLQRHTRPRTVRWRPGTVVSYSNLNYMLLAYILEQNYGPAAWSRDAARLGMSTAEFADQPYLFTPAMGFRASITDLGKLLRFFATHGARAPRPAINQPEAMFALMETPGKSLAVEAGMPVGFGAGLEVESFSGRLQYGHYGKVEGAAAYFTYDPHLRRGFAMIARGPGAVSAQLPGREVLQAAVFPASLAPEVPTTSAEIVTADPTQWTGRYRRKNLRNQLFAFHDDLFATVRVRPGDLQSWLKLGRGLDFRPVAPAQYRRDGSPDDVLQFGETEEGMAYLQWNHRYFERISGNSRRVKLTLLSLFRAVMGIGAGIWLWLLGFRLLRYYPGGTGLLRMSTWGALPVLAAALGFYLLTHISFRTAGVLNLETGLLFLCSVVIPLATGLHLWTWLRGWRQTWNRWWMLFQGILLAGNVALTVYMGIYGLLFLRLWMD